MRRRVTLSRRRSWKALMANDDDSMSIRGRGNNGFEIKQGSEENR